MGPKLGSVTERHPTPHILRHSYAARLMQGWSRFCSLTSRITSTAIYARLTEPTGVL